MLTLLVAGCGSPDDPASGAGTERREVIKLAISPWVGYEANAAVISYLLEHELGYRVDRKEFKETVAWQGLESGEVDLIVENWGHDDLKEQYIEDKKVAVEVGPTGNTGVIGWYVPKWLANEHPGILSWQGLNANAALFRTPASGGQGQLLDGDPTFVTNDEALVRNLRLDFKVVYAGSERETIKAALRSAKERTPLLFYFYEPQWLHSQEEFVRIGLPPHRPGCDADSRAVTCGYPEYILDKIVASDFAREHPDAYELVENFSWSNKEQNQVANDIANGGLTPEAAAAKWIRANKATWQAWLPNS